MSKLKNSNLRAQRTEHEGGSVGVLPVHHAPDARPGHVGGVVLGPDEAVLHQRAFEGVDAIPVCPPGEDLDPPDLCQLLWVVVSGLEHEGVVGRVGDGDALHPG